MIRPDVSRPAPPVGSGPDHLAARLIRDVRYAVRRLAARPGFTATAILSLALGIGANSAMFTLVNEVIFRRPPVAEPERLVHLYSSRPNSPFDAMAYPDLVDLARGTQDIFSGLATATFAIVSTEQDGRPERLIAELLSPGFFGVLGIRPAVGRLFDSTDAPAIGSGSIAVLSNAYWRRAYGGRADVVGKTIRLGGKPYQIVGVTPAEYGGTIRGVTASVFLPVTMASEVNNEPDFFTNRSNQGTFATARLEPGVGLAQARVAIDRVVTDLRERWPAEWDQTRTVSMLPDREVIVWPPIDRILVPAAWMLMVVVGLVLVVACANLAAFLLARAVDRRKEIAVRLALGATRGQLMTQLLVETVLLALGGGLAGVLLGRAALRLVLAADLPLPVPLTLDLTLDWRVLTFSVGMSIAAGIFFGLAPAIQSTRLELASVIRDETTGGGRRKGRLRSVLLGGQVAVAVVLLIAAGLFVRSLDAARQVDPGFGHAPTVTVWLGLPNTRTSIEALGDFDRIRARVGEIPGIEAVGMMSNIHLNVMASSATTIQVDGVEPPRGQQGHQVDHAVVDTGFFSAMGLELRAGRGFRIGDSSSRAPVAIVNEAFARKFWPGREPIGQRFRRLDGREVEVVGLVNTVKIRSLDEEPRPFIYEPITADGASVYWLIARARQDAEGAQAQVLAAIRRESPQAFVIDAQTMARHISLMSLPFRLAATALACFAGLAMVMASVGLYGTVSYAVAQRSREVGIRLSLGADRRSVIRLLLWGGLRLVLVGVGSGLAVAALAARLLQGLLFGVRAVDPVTFVVVPIVLVAVAGLAAWVPARRAGAVDPLRALKAGD
jgi:putative ABC transport system permease protein